MSEAKAIRTNGEGNRSDYHLNFDVPLGPPEPKQANQWTKRTDVVRTVVDGGIAPLIR